MSSETTRRRRPRLPVWRKRAALALTALVVVGGAGVATQAGFTSTATSTVTAEVGKVEIKANDSSSTTVTFGGGGVLGPGEYRESIIVSNVGTLPVKLSWTRTSSAIGGPNGGTSVNEASLESWVSVRRPDGTEVGSSTTTGKRTLDNFVLQNAEPVKPGYTVEYELVLRIEPGATRITGTRPEITYEVTATQA